MRYAGAQAAPDADSDDSYFVGSDSNRCAPTPTLHHRQRPVTGGERRADRLRPCSEDSAVRRLRNAERQLYDREEALSAAAELPDPLAVLGAATQRPRFLDPEATRPLAEPVHRGRPPPRPCDEPADRPEGGRKRAPGDWDIASMAPPLKGTAEAPRGVISAPAKRYRTDERVGPGAVTAAQVH